MQPEQLATILRKVMGSDTKLECCSNVAGGSINLSQFVQTNKGGFFVKFSHSQAAADMLSMEARGLDTLRATRTLKLPEVIAQGVFSNGAYLLLEWLPSKPKTAKYWRKLGSGLANLHQCKAATYGLAYDNYFGSLPQDNAQSANGIDFFINQRLVPHIAEASQQALISNEEEKLLQEAINRLPAILTPEEPSLLHGDLWNGNVVCSDDACLIDPAIYYGNREADIAMTTLFGGFDAAFYEAYQEAYPLKAGWEERLAVYNLYPLLFHLNAFGRGYWPQIEAISTQILRTYRI